ncbi:sulfotransferase [Sphingobium sp. JS3065]|uniref:sulfotransferase family protein n=1 Tax=Sphingobium sp. JS3065 TaxID=2970925 RepID=UPI002263EE6E|nr:sulfotransferase [Sphingobium sp. JS3065]UZW57534.1 sulfotransferase [Sphingobium sp. JS3065]
MSALFDAKELQDVSLQMAGAGRFQDMRFQDGFERLIASVNQEARIGDAAALRERYLRLLSNRLRFERDLSAEPGILEERLAPPLVIIGLPRVGSTKLQRLLGASGDFQDLLFWQTFNAGPANRGEGPEARIADAMRFLRWRSAANPKVDAAHHLAATAPEEEMYLKELSFTISWPMAYLNVPSFIDWLRGADHDYVFEELRRLLQYHQWQFHRGGKRPYILKAPPNLGFEEEISRHFPDARFIMLHRDPVDVIPSLGALSAQVRCLYSAGEPDVASVTRWWFDEFDMAMQRHLRWRDRKPQSAVLDVGYQELLQDDLGVVRRIYAFLGMELGEQHCVTLMRASSSNQQHAQGRHEYSLATGGVGRDEIAEAFSVYSQRFADYL